VKRCPASGKRSYGDYAEALASMDCTWHPGRGQVYTCTACGELHVSTRVFTNDRNKGRGKRRRNPSIYRGWRGAA
jgi:hypothetical protein